MSASQVEGKGKAKYVWRVVGYFVLLAIINTITFEISSITPSSISSWVASILEGTFYLAATLALTWSFCSYLDRTSLGQLGLRKRKWFAYLGAGWLLGALLVFLMFAVLWVAGWVTVKIPNSWQGPDFVASMYSWLVIAFVEELAFRGYIMQGLSRAWGMPVAVAVSSLLFGGVHALNPNASILGVLTICLAGVFYAIAYLLTKSLWLPIGLHMGWNLMEVHILGMPGSGHTEPSILHTIAFGPELVTGGAFGPEGGILSLVAEVLGILVLLVALRIALARKELRNN